MPVIRSIPSTPHLYLSVLPLLPNKSKFRQIYLPRFPNTVQLIPGIPIKGGEYTDFPPEVIRVMPRIIDSKREYISHLDFSLDNNMLISCTTKGIVHVRSMKDFTLLREYRTCKHQDRIRIAKFSYDNRFIYCLTLYCASLWSWEVAKAKFTEIDPSNDISCFDVFGEKIIAGCHNGDLRIWTEENIGPAEITGSTIIHIGNHSLDHICVAPDGMAAVAERDIHAVHIIDIVTHESIRVLRCQDNFLGRITDLAWSSTSDCLAVALSGSHKNLGLLFREKDWDFVCKTINADGGLGMSLEWLRGSSILCVNTRRYRDSGTIVLWDVETQQEILNPIYHCNWPSSIAISPDGRTLATGPSEDSLKIWDVEMLLGQGQPAAANIPQSPESCVRQLLQKSKVDDHWVITSDNKRLLLLPRRSKLLLDQNCMPKYSTGEKLDFSRFVHGERWTECYDPGYVIQE